MSLQGSTDPRVSNILIVDDDPLVGKAMNALLVKAGFRSIACGTGAEALKRAERSIDAAIVDIHLPDINGLELSAQLRRLLGPLAPIVILSGDTSMDTIRALPEAGATYFFSKPVNADMLLEHLKKWMGGRESQ